MRHESGWEPLSAKHAAKLSYFLRLQGPSLVELGRCHYGRNGDREERPGSREVSEVELTECVDVRGEGPP